MNAPAWQTRPATLAVGFLIVAVSILALQGFFDRSDHRKAKALVRDLSKVNGISLGRYLSEVKYPGATETEWDSEITSGCAGYANVTFAVPQRSGDKLVYRFKVEIEKKAMHPDNELARQLIIDWEAYAKKLPPDAATRPLPKLAPAP